MEFAWTFCPDAGRQVNERTVRQVMTDDVFGVAPEATLAELAAFFARSGLGRAIVQKDGELLGIVSVTDLLELMAEVLPPERVVESR